jgi:hypothetical protein
MSTERCFCFLTVRLLPLFPHSKGWYNDNYLLLEARAGEDLDLQILFWKYQRYLEREAPLLLSY